MLKFFKVKNKSWKWNNFLNCKVSFESVSVNENGSFLKSIQAFQCIIKIFLAFLQSEFFEKTKDVRLIKTKKKYFT